MIPQNDYDFSKASWTTAIIGIAKLAVIIGFILVLLIGSLIALAVWKMPQGDEIHQDELQRWCNSRFPHLTFDQCVDQEGL